MGSSIAIVVDVVCLGGGVVMKAIVCTKYGPPDVIELKEEN
jgi:hypothetical protein